MKIFLKWLIFFIFYKFYFGLINFYYFWLDFCGEYLL
jgi:hypothetical protein